MFPEKKAKKNNVEPSTAQNRISEGTTLKGDISSSGFFRIDGSIEGNVNTPSKVVLGKTGEIKGTLSCENADLEGKFEGSLQVTGTLTLRSTALVEGEIVVGKLSVEPGAVLNASCIMQDGKPKAGLNAPKLPGDSQPRLFNKKQKVKETSTLTKSD
ncbi:bactofilin family protein [Aequorivita xiaoshiensis]|uniref:Polymer-forming cytoskeletal protein n=1 Tax=Aequorivita xiaoshiensis TaxID=2874476 RepID=A0A9X1QWX1_9FLAO|nr:polymer-forming cytoskeletal protein [Aequorivita xiaoshiensis]MCG2429996.1 polymer-forming cytoskeletal protein [Aequorivita xiaoshiensis]